MTLGSIVTVREELAAANHRTVHRICMSETLRPRLIVVAGPNGAGKTSITEQLLRHEWMGGCAYVNPDYIAHDEFGDWNAPDAVRKLIKHHGNINP